MKTITFGGNVIAALFKMFCGLILVIVALLDVSCATIVRGTKDTLVVESAPSGSIVTLSNGMVGKTPASFVVPRTKNLVVKIEHDGYEPVQVYVVPQAFSESGSGWIGGNVLAGGIVGIAVDGFSGAMYDLQPNPVRVRLVARNSDNLPVPTDGLVKDAGTGFFITEDGYFLTNHHVVKNAPFVEVVVTDQGKKRARLIGFDEDNDLAVLKVEGQFSALPLIASKDVELGDPVFTVGFPHTATLGVLPKLTKGSINSLAGMRDKKRDFQTSVPIQPGNSGGPLVDEAGNVIGIVASSLVVKPKYKLVVNDPQLVNYAVKSSYALAFLETLPSIYGKLREPFPKEQSEDRTAIHKRTLAATFRVRISKYPPPPVP